MVFTIKYKVFLCFPVNFPIIQFYDYLPFPEAGEIDTKNTCRIFMKCIGCGHGGCMKIPIWVERAQACRSGDTPHCGCTLQRFYKHFDCYSTISIECSVRNLCNFSTLNHTWFMPKKGSYWPVVLRVVGTSQYYSTCTRQVEATWNA